MRITYQHSPSDDALLHFHNIFIAFFLTTQGHMRIEKKRDFPLKLDMDDDSELFSSNASLEVSNAR
jgi:hypothetical protein